MQLLNMRGGEKKERKSVFGYIFSFIFHNFFTSNDNYIMSKMVSRE